MQKNMQMLKSKTLLEHKFSLRMKRKYMIFLFIRAIIILSFLSFIGFTYYTYGLGNKIILEETIVGKKDYLDIVEYHNLSEKFHAIREEIRNLKQEIHASIVPQHKIKTFQTYIYQNKTDQNLSQEEITPLVISSNVHIFYYPWYKSEIFDGRYGHWNHRMLPNWKVKYERVQPPHKPPDDIGSNFYPKLGPYSSSDPKVLNKHMEQIKYSGAGVLAVSWYPPNLELENEEPVDNIMLKILDFAQNKSLQVTFHIEPFKNRSGENIVKVIKYIIDTYGSHKAFYRTLYNGKLLPLYYLYDSYQISSFEWSKALSREGQFSLRNSKYDGIFLGLLARQDHMNHLAASNFDGFYTYFAIDGFEYGSTFRNWALISAEAKKLKLIFVPSIGPGYVDTRIRPWNDRNTRKRSNGQYYRAAFLAALEVKPKFLSITSFNEWHEGTQIEPAVPKTFGNYRYEDYLPRSEDFYLRLTQSFVKEFIQQLNNSRQIG
ncbi:glycoprotein endo-alpha-1 2-mannosidase-like isoform X1 [Biomphalaria glabrata]